MYVVTAIDPANGDTQHAVETAEELARLAESLNWASVLRIIVVWKG